MADSGADAGGGATLVLLEPSEAPPPSRSCCMILSKPALSSFNGLALLGSLTNTGKDAWGITGSDSTFVEGWTADNGA